MQAAESHPVAHTMDGERAPWPLLLRGVFPLQVGLVRAVAGVLRDDYLILAAGAVTSGHILGLHTFLDRISLTALAKAHYGFLVLGRDWVGGSTITTIEAWPKVSAVAGVWKQKPR